MSLESIVSFDSPHTVSHGAEEEKGKTKQEKGQELVGRSGTSRYLVTMENRGGYTNRGWLHNQGGYTAGGD